MNRKHVTLLAIAGLAACTVSATAMAENTVRLRAGVAAVQYVAPDPNGDIKSDFNALLLGATLITDAGWFFDLGSRTSTSAKWNAQDLFPPLSDQDFERRDLTLTVGKALGNGLSVFGGYQAGDSELTLDSTPLGGTKDWLKQKTQGFFVGVGKGFAVGNGTLALSGALGMMKAEITDSFGGPTEKSDSGSGVSLGLAYNYFFTKSIGITADLKYQSYRLKYADFSGDERLTQLGLSLVGQF